MASAAANDPVQDARAGITVKPENSFELAEAIDKLVKLSPDQRIAMGEAARAYVERNHSFSVLALKFAKVFDELDQ
jgi:glycosyltransferase involved in cell wall biosynthesis